MLNPARSRSDIATLPHRGAWCASEAPILPAALCADLLDGDADSARSTRAFAPTTAVPPPFTGFPPS